MAVTARFPSRLGAERSRFIRPWPDFSNNTISFSSGRTNAISFACASARMFRLRPSPQTARALLTEYLLEANALADQPQYYNTLTANCTTEIARLLHWVGIRFAYDWRIFANGYLPDYLYENGVLNHTAALADLRRLGEVGSRAHRDLDSIAFSAALRCARACQRRRRTKRRGDRKTGKRITPITGRFDLGDEAQRESS